MIVPPLPRVIPNPTFNPPTPSIDDLQGSTNVLETLPGRDVSKCTDIIRCRTMTNVVFSCLSTIFACTWVALHPPVPEPNQSFWKSLWCNLQSMLWAIVTPELVAATAVKERLAARKYADDWNANFVPLCFPELVSIQGKTVKQYEHELKDKNYDSRWTLTHGFLAGMGGIRVYNDGSNGFEEFEPTETLFKDHKMRSVIQKIGLISPKDIEDKSKGDAISKLFVVVQTSWFIVQCLARWTAHLPVTELEVVTLAYAVQNIFIYVIWWNKPQGLLVPYRFYLEKDEETSEDQEGKAASKQGGVPLMQRSPGSNIADEESISKSETYPERCFSGQGQSHIANEWIKPTHFGIQGFFMALLGGNGDWLVFISAGAIFGGLHLIPIWLSVFPSNVEKILWQVSALLITVIPVSAVFVVRGINKWKDEPFSWTGDLISVAKTFAICITAAYPIARVILLVLPFTTLRSLPVEAFLIVKWTRFIPHF